MRYHFYAIDIFNLLALLFNTGGSYQWGLCPVNASGQFLYLKKIDIDRIATEQKKKKRSAFGAKMVLKRPTMPIIDQGSISGLYPLLTPNFLRLTESI